MTKGKSKGEDVEDIPFLGLVIFLPNAKPTGLFGFLLYTTKGWGGPNAFQAAIRW